MSILSDHSKCLPYLLQTYAHLRRLGYIVYRYRAHLHESAVTASSIPSNALNTQKKSEENEEENEDQVRSDKGYVKQEGEGMEPISWFARARDFFSALVREYTWRNILCIYVCLRAGRVIKQSHSK